MLLQKEVAGRVAENLSKDLEGERCQHGWGLLARATAWPLGKGLVMECEAGILKTPARHLPVSGSGCNTIPSGGHSKMHTSVSHRGLLTAHSLSRFQPHCILHRPTSLLSLRTGFEGGLVPGQATCSAIFICSLHLTVGKIRETSCCSISQKATSRHAVSVRLKSLSHWQPLTQIRELPQPPGKVSSDGPSLSSGGCNVPTLGDF